MSATEPLDLLIFRGSADDSARRHEMIAQAAYFLAKSRHFAPGGEQEDWLAAEAQVDEFLSGHAAYERNLVPEAHPDMP